jgi:hypothetical protein
LRRSGSPPLIPRNVAPKSRIWSTSRMALAVSISSGKGGLPAEAQCAQLLSHANVHRQGKMYKGPFCFNVSTPNKLLVKCYLTLHEKASESRAADG